MKKLGLCLLPVAFALAGPNLRAEPASEPEFESVTRRDYYDMLLRSEQALRDEKSADAFQLNQRLACAGNQPNQAALGGLYLAGRGVARDDLTGYAWLKLAAASGLAKYQNMAEALEKSMTPEQRALADTKVATLKSLYAPIPTHMTCSQDEVRGSHRKELKCEPEPTPEGRSFVWLKRCAPTP